MCKDCGDYENNSTRHLLYWQYEWLKRFLRTWYHIVYRKAYYNWAAKNCETYKKNKIQKMLYQIDEGLRMDLDEIIKK
jgi:hypothetical protein